MSQTHWILAIACAAASACASTSCAPVRAAYTTKLPTGSLQVRNYDGDALPPYALTDAQAYLEIECRNGQVYQVVDRSPDPYSSTMKQTTASASTGLNGICDRMQGSRLEFGR